MAHRSRTRAEPGGGLTQLHRRLFVPGNKAKLLKTSFLGLCLWCNGCGSVSFALRVFCFLFVFPLGLFWSLCLFLCLFGSRCGGHVGARQQRL